MKWLFKLLIDDYLAMKIGKCQPQVLAESSGSSSSQLQCNLKYSWIMLFTVIVFVCQHSLSLLDYYYIAAIKIYLVPTHVMAQFACLFCFI